MKPWIARIRKLMQERGMTQESLATELGRGQSWVNHKLSGRRKANVEDIVLIAQALNIEPAALLNNVTNFDKLADNFLGVAENQARYSSTKFADLERKLSDLNKQDLDAFLEQMESQLDLLLEKKNQSK